MEKEQQVGITETGEIAFNLDAFNNLRRANIIITKRLTDALIEKLIEHQDKIILHLTCTGMGGTVIEPFVPTADEILRKFSALIEKGFPISHVVLRVDPIIPTPKGVKTALSVVKKFVNGFPDLPRIRWSSIDMYEHVLACFKEKGITPPFETFSASKVKINALYSILQGIGYVNGIDIEACGENGFNQPCISQRDLDILGITDIVLTGSAEQRNTCHCPANKVQLIHDKPKRCANSCLYCYWKED